VNQPESNNSNGRGQAKISTLSPDEVRERLWAYEDFAAADEQLRMHQLFQVERQRGAGHAQFIPNIPCHAASRASDHQQTEDGQALGVSQRGQRGDCFNRFHKTRIVETLSREQAREPRPAPSSS